MSISSLRRLTIDLAKSRGVYLADNLGEMYLDLNNNIASLPLGYNHKNLVELSKCPKFNLNSIHRQSLNLFPTDAHFSLLKDIKKKISPIDNANMILTSSGSEAVENSIKMCYMLNNGFGKILCFKDGFHGRTLGSLSLTNTNPEHKLFFPCLGTVLCAFPNTYNKFRIDEYLNKISNKINVNDVAGIIIEPILSEGGDLFTSEYFFRELRKLASENNIPFVIDEIQTGMGTGKIWAHEHWNLDKPPDIVCFSKKFQMSGLLYNNEYQLYSPYAFNSTWAGDICREMMLKVILDTIESDNLLEKSFLNGNYFFDRLREIPSITNVRNKGSFGSFDVKYRDSFINELLLNQIIVTGCGENSVRIRPSLIFENKDFEVALDIIERISKRY